MANKMNVTILPVNEKKVQAVIKTSNKTAVVVTGSKKKIKKAIRNIERRQNAGFLSVDELFIGIEGDQNRQ